MSHTSIPSSYITLAAVLALLVFSKILIKVVRKPKFKGWVGEKSVQAGLGARLSSNIYRQFHDLLVPNGRGGLTQIDHVILSPYGVFVIETKDYSGWIFCGENDAKWTVSYKGGKKKQFMNPLRQNYGHIKALESLFGIPSGPIIGLVYFSGDADFKTAVPTGVLTGSLASRILSYKNKIFPDNEIDRMVALLEQAKAEDSKESRQRHLAQIKK